MTERQEQVLNSLMDWPTGQTASDIANTHGIPEPSVRRTIQELIRDGHNISYALDGRYVWRKGVR